jgi:3-oxoacyl-[acyl-carrier-protein] synthase III
MSSENDCVASVFRGVGRYLPEKVVTNDDLAKLMDTSDEWIKERSGISQRHMVDDSESTSEMGYKAAVAALEDAKIDPSEVDLILASTITPDYYFPGIGVLIQRKLGKLIPAIDIRAQCSGFAWSMSTADAFLQTKQYKKILIIGSEIHSRLLEFSNRGRNVSVLFGDGAGAAVIEGNSVKEKPSVTNSIRGIIDSYMCSDGSGAELLISKRPGMSAGNNKFMTAEELQDNAFRPMMEGRQVFKNAVLRMSEAANILLERNKVSISEIDILIPHQANVRIASAVAERLGLEKEKLFTNIEHYGNTTSASIPLCLYDAKKQKRLTPGTLALVVAFGSGFTWGSNLIRW